MQPELKTVLKRAAESILDKGGNLRKIESLGFMDLPHKMSLNQQTHKQAHYFLFAVDLPTLKMKEFNEECGRDLDVIRAKSYQDYPVETTPCTLEDELVPPSYRKDVKKLLKMDKRHRTNKWRPNSGIDYYPFQR